MAASKLKPLSAWMAERNSAYYKSASTSIYDDFETYAQSPKGLLTCANANAFHQWALLHPQDSYNVLETGVGEGAFALGFLTELAEADREHGTQFSSMLRYTLADFSIPMLEKAKTRLAREGFGGQIEILEWDATHPTEFSNSSFDLIRCNELFSDLPADVYVRSGEDLFSVNYDSDLQPQQVPLPWEALSRSEADLVRALPADYHLPINRAAKNAILFLSHHLAPEGRFDIFDYGFYRAEDFVIPADMWNLSLVREFNSQWTVDLNFLYLSASLAEAKFRTRVEPQAEYAEIYRDVCSRQPVSTKTAQKEKSKKDGKGEKAKKDGKAKNQGLDYDEESEDGVEEDDFFYHMEVQP